MILRHWFTFIISTKSCVWGLVLGSLIILNQHIWGNGPHFRTCWLRHRSAGSAAAAFGGYLRDLQWPHGGQITIFQGRLVPKPGCCEIVFRQNLLEMLYDINEAHKQYSLLDTVFSYIFHFGPPGKYLYTGFFSPNHGQCLINRTVSYKI